VAAVIGLLQAKRSVAAQAAQPGNGATERLEQGDWQQKTLLSLLAAL
jgi:hypothetical protein